MGLLPDDYFTNTLKDQNPSQPQAPVAPAVSPALQVNNTAPVSAPQDTIQPAEPVDPFPQLTPEEQTAKFGGVVGSPEYLDYQNKRLNSKSIDSITGPGGIVDKTGQFMGNLAGALGVQLPDQESWDKMGAGEHVEKVVDSSLKAAAMAVLGFPRAVADVVASGANTVYEGWSKITKGTPFSVPDQNPSPMASVPSYFKTYSDARTAGNGKLASAVMTGGKFAQDSLITANVAEALRNSFAPPAQQLAEGTKLTTTEPVQTILQQEKDKLAARRGSDTSSEYHTMTKTDAKNFGGNSGNTFIKFSPASVDGSKIELSIVKVKSAIGNFFDNLKSKVGIDTDTVHGKFGPEQKVFSKIVDVGQNSEIGTENIPEIENGTPKVDATIPSAPTKGFEDQPVTSEHIANLEAIGKTNNIDPSLQEAVVKALSGKDVVGDLTQGEYVNVAQAMAKLGKASEYSPDAVGFGNWIKNYFSPTRYWTRDVQEATGIPIHDAHMQLETGARLAKIAERTQLGSLYDDPIVQKYSGSQYAEYRPLVKEYMEGRTGAITDNPSLTPEMKNDLIHSAQVFDTYMKGVATDIGMDPQVFIDNYAPHIQERGGVFQLYKEDGNIPGGSNAFFREKRSGGLFTQVNDPWALADIYTRSAYKAKYIGPALDAMNEFKDSLPSGIRDRLASYVQEKLGYGGKFEKVLDSVATSLNKKLGWNLPEDTARVVTNQALNTMYSSAMSQPATWVRNAFQYPTMGYAYWGSKFMADALKMGYSEAGMKEFLKSGFSVDLGVPFGEDLTKDASPMGKANNAYRDFTQTTLQPHSWVENRNRAPMYFQSKMMFDDAVSKFNSGRLTWTQAEKAMGLDKMNPVDANQVRQSLVSGDMNGARDKVIQSALDDTQFPYRKGESWRLGYGMAGKLSTPFMQWPVEYMHTLGSWVANGQWDRVARLYASSALMIKTFTQSYNTDFSKSLFTGPVQNINLTPPPLTIAQNMVGLFSNSLSDNEQAYQKNGDELMKELHLAVPGGAEGANIMKFYSAYKKGPDDNGMYSVPDSSGRPTLYNFRDLFWNALGMPTNSRTENQNLQSDMATSKFEYTQAKSKVVNLYQDGLSQINAGRKDAGQSSIDQANQIIQEYAKQGLDLSPTDADFNKFYIPANQQTWNALPDALKAKFAPRVFNQTKK